MSSTRQNLKLIIFITLMINLVLPNIYAKSIALEAMNETTLSKSDLVDLLTASSLRAMTDLKKIGASDEYLEDFYHKMMKKISSLESSKDSEEMLSRLLLDVRKSKIMREPDLESYIYSQRLDGDKIRYEVCDFTEVCIELGVFSVDEVTFNPKLRMLAATVIAGAEIYFTWPVVAGSAILSAMVSGAKAGSAVELISSLTGIAAVGVVVYEIYNLLNYVSYGLLNILNPFKQFQLASVYSTIDGNNTPTTLNKKTLIHVLKDHDERKLFLEEFNDL